MFERLTAHAGRLAAARAGRRRGMMAEALRARGVPGVAVNEEGERVVLSGRRLGQRMAVDPELRWLVAESRDDG